MRGRDHLVPYTVPLKVGTNAATVMCGKKKLIELKSYLFEATLMRDKRIGHDAEVPIINNNIRIDVKDVTIKKICIGSYLMCLIY